MGWSSLGIKQPGFEWEFFEIPVFGDVATRITQTYNPAEVSFLNKIQLGEFYATPDNEFRYLRTIYPSTQPWLFSFSIPQPLQDAGYTMREFAVRHNRYGVAAVANWTIEIEVWY